MEAGHRSFLYREQAAVAVINFVLNGLCGWLIFKSLSRVRIWGWHQSAAGDLVVTGFIIGFLVSFLVTRFSPKKMMKLHIAPIRPEDAGIYAMLPGPLFARSLLVGVVGAAAAAVILAVYGLTGVESMAMREYVLVKSIAAAVFAVICNHMTLMKAFTELRTDSVKGM